MKISPVIAACIVLAVSGCAASQAGGTPATGAGVDLVLASGAAGKPAPLDHPNALGELTDESRRDPAGRRYDCLHFRLDQGQTLTVSVSLFGYDSQVLFYRDSDCQGGLMPFSGPNEAGHVAFTAPASSTYSLSAGAADANGRGHYILSIEAE